MRFLNQVVRVSILLGSLEPMLKEARSRSSFGAEGSCFANLSVGMKVNVKSNDPVYHETKPPARYSEAALVKILEGGNGRLYLCKHNGNHC